MTQEYALIELLTNNQQTKEKRKLVIKTQNIRDFDKYRFTTKNRIYRYFTEEDGIDIKCLILKTADSEEELMNPTKRTGRPVYNQSSLESSGKEDEPQVSFAKKKRKLKAYNEANVKRHMSADIIKAYAAKRNDGNGNQQKNEKEEEKTPSEDGDGQDDERKTYVSETEDDERDSQVGEERDDENTEEDEDDEEGFEEEGEEGDETDEYEEDDEEGSEEDGKQKSAGHHSNQGRTITKDKKGTDLTKEQSDDKTAKGDTLAPKKPRTSISGKDSTPKIQRIEILDEEAERSAISKLVKQNNDLLRGIESRDLQIQRLKRQKVRDMHGEDQPRPRQQERARLQRQQEQERLRHEPQLRNNPEDRRQIVEPTPIGGGILVPALCHQEAFDTSNPSKFITILSHAIWTPEILATRTVRKQINTVEKALLTPEKKFVLKENYKEFLNKRGYSRDMFNVHVQRMNTYLGRAITSARKKIA